MSSVHSQGHGMILTNSDTQMQGAKQFSAACERNREPVLRALQPLLRDASTVLEIGSGSGQHAVYFARHLPHLTWYTSDRAENHASIRAWIADAELPNVRPPCLLDVDDAPWSLPHCALDSAAVDAVFSANTLHIFSWPQVCRFFRGVGPWLRPSGHLCVYGPFKVDGAFISAGDAQFDAYLKAQSPASGLRDVARVDELAQQQEMTLVAEHLLPANNRLLVWQKRRDCA